MISCRKIKNKFNINREFVIKKGRLPPLTLGDSAGAVLRGGNWNNGINTGVFTSNLNNSAANTNTNIGFRCVFWAESGLRLKVRLRDRLSDKFIVSTIKNSYGSSSHT